MKYPTRSPLLLTLSALLTLTGSGWQAAQPVPGAEVYLAVKGRMNATPSIAASGQFVAVAWGATTREGKADVFVATSTDGGRVFTAPVQVNTVAGEARLGGELPPRIAVRRASASAAPDVAVLWTARGASTSIKLARSSDGGRTFEAPRELQSPGAAGDRGWTALALDPRGAATAIWLDHRGMAVAGSPPHVHGAAKLTDGVAMAARSALYFASDAQAGGAGPTAEREVTTGVCYCCKTSLVVADDGAIHAAWRHVYPGNLRDIAFATSRDGGRTFSAPVRVSQDGWEINGCPDDGPSLTVDRKGTVHVAWPTLVTDGKNLQGAIFYASTRDGRTFTPRRQVTIGAQAKPSHPQVIIDPAGRPVVAWDQAGTGGRSIFVERLDPAGKSPGEAAAPFQAPGAYPALAVTSDSAVAAWTNPGPEATRITVRRLAAAGPQ